MYIWREYEERVEVAQKVIEQMRYRDYDFGFGFDMDGYFEEFVPEQQVSLRRRVADAFVAIGGRIDREAVDSVAEPAA